MTFKLSENFVDIYKTKTPPWGPVGEVTYLRTYSRTKEDGTNEVWWETCRRVVEGTFRVQERHAKHYRLPWSAQKAQKSAQLMFERMFTMKFLPPGRGLWVAGTPLVDRIGCAALMNCAFVSTKDLKTSLSDPFCFLMDFSMCGVGVGFDTLGAGTLTIKEPGPKSTAPWVVGDSREGWVEALRLKIESYTGQTDFDYDFTKIREAGSPVRGFGGTAAGPQPLIDLLDAVDKILSPLVGTKITSTAIVDLANLIGRCVVAGNIRRSAELAIGDINDAAFLDLKNPETNGEALRSHRWASNNSVGVTVGAEYAKVAELLAKNGEPGIIWLDNARKFSRMGRPADNKDARVMGFNPCVEQGLEDHELCCLVETFPARHESIEDYLVTLKYAYLYAKTVTLLPTHNEKANAVVLRNRRIGTSMSGVVQAKQKFGTRKFFELCDAGYDYLQRLDEVYSDWLCVPRSLKTTTVKPSGTVSLLPGATPGVHYPHSEYYFRTIRFQSSSPLLVGLREAGYRIEPDAYSPNTSVVYFPVHEEHFDRSKNDVTMWEQLELAAAMQHYWSDNGVSVTVTFKKEEAPHIKHALELYENRLKAVSFLPLSDHGYIQAPYQEISRDEYEAYCATLKPLRLSGTNEVQDAFCDGDKCVLPRRTAA